jgi:predicted phosphodiesterase
MKLQIASDLHLEHLDSDEFHLLIEPVAPILILAGDIASHGCNRLAPFLSYVSQSFEHVLWILGNHEYYDANGKSMHDIVATLRGMCPNNVHILDNEVWEDGNLVILGTTLWSKILQQQKDKIERTVRDFRCIYKQTGQLLSTDDVNELHQCSVAFLQDRLDATFGLNKKLVIVTHHVPFIFNGIRGDPLHSAFASDVVLKNDGDVRLWVCGHTHHNFVTKKEHYTIVSNQFGYEGEHDGRGYRYDCTMVLIESLYEAMTPND